MNDIKMNTSNMSNSSKAEYNKVLVDETEKKREEWAENLKTLPPLLRSQVEHMVDANALALSYRTMLLEELHYFMSELAQEHKIMKELRANKFIFYTTGLMPDGTRPTGKLAAHPLAGNAKLSGPNKELIMSGDFSEFEYTIDILSHMIEFLRENIKTIDQTLYSVKNRIEMFNILGGR